MEPGLGDVLPQRRVWSRQGLGEYLFGFVLSCEAAVGERVFAAHVGGVGRCTPEKLFPLCLDLGEL